MQWECALEVEWVKEKREWLRSFSKPSVSGGDLTQCADGTLCNHVTDRPDCLPAWLVFWVAGWSCKDFSTLNHRAAAYSDKCLSVGVGTTGSTWKGNLDIVRLCRPFSIIYENVKGALSPWNLAIIEKELAEQGYKLVYTMLNAADSGFPQDRERAWFLGIREDLASEEFTWPNFQDLIDCLKIPCSLHLSEFLLPPKHPYLVAVMDAKRQAAAKKAARASAKKVMKRPGSTTTTKRSGKEWLLDNWKARRMLGLGPVRDVPQEVQAVMTANGMPEREADLYRLFTAVPHAPDPSIQPGLELKYSAGRVVELKSAAARRRREGSTSCRLPLSRFM